MFAVWFEEQSLVVNLLTEIFSGNSISVYFLLSEARYESITFSVNIHVDPQLFTHKRICSGKHGSLCKPQTTLTLYGFLLAKVHICPSVAVSIEFTHSSFNCGVSLAQWRIPNPDGGAWKKWSNLLNELDMRWVPWTDSEILSLKNYL